MNEQTLNRITKEAEEKYNSKTDHAINATAWYIDELQQQAYIAGATLYAERSEKLRDENQKLKHTIETLTGKKAQICEDCGTYYVSNDRCPECNPMG